MDRTLMNTPASAYNDHLTHEQAYDVIEAYFVEYGTAQDHRGGILAIFDAEYERTDSAALGIWKALQAVRAESAARRLIKPDYLCHLQSLEEETGVTDRPARYLPVWVIALCWFVLGMLAMFGMMRR